jgi:hypothetical protein
MGAWLALVALQAALITVRGGDARCPSGRQVNEAIAARLPGVLVPTASSGASGVLELRLTESATEHSFVVVDPEGAVRLSRPLPPPSPSARDCEALAETVALIVDRYLQQLAYQDREMPPPAPAPPPERPRRWELFAGGTWLPATGEQGDMASYEALLGLGRELNHRWGQNAGRLWRFPAELRLFWRPEARSVRFEVGPFAGLHLLLLAPTVAQMQPNELRYVPVLGGMGAVRVSLGTHLFARLVMAGAVDVVRYTFRPCEGMPDPNCPLLHDGNEPFGTQRSYVKMGVEGGVAFW